MKHDIVPVEDSQVTLESERAEAEAAAVSIVESFPTIGQMIVEYDRLHTRFTEMRSKFLKELQIVRDYFSHKAKRKGSKELFLGKYRTGEEWTRAELGIGYQHFMRCVPKLGTPLLPEETSPAEDAATEEVKEIKDSTSLDAIAARLTKLFPMAEVLPARTKNLFNVTFRDLNKDQIKKLAALKLVAK
jgi:hypothetical protein